MNTLRELVNQNRTIIATLYQGPSHAFELFDSLILLSHGSVIYNGPANEAVSFFIQNPSYGIVRSHSCVGFSIQRSENGGGIYKTTISSDSSSPQEPVNPVDYLLAVSTALRIEDSDPVMNTKRKVASTNHLNSEFDDIDPDNILIEERPAFALYTKDVTYSDISHIKLFLVHGQIIFERSFYILYYRWKLVVSTVFLHFCFALIFPITLGDSSDDEYAIMAFYGYGAMLIILAGVQFAPFLMNSNEVFLKEHSRGLYGSWSQWIFGSVHYTALRCSLGVMMGYLAGTMMDLRKKTMGFYLLALLVHSFGASSISEFLIFNSPDLRTAYTLIPSFGFILFFFSSLMIKPSSYPDLLKAWIPSISIIRWIAQCMTVNEFKDNENMWNNDRYSTYEHLMSLFGWGGKTKWECLKFAVFNAAVFRFFVLWVLFNKSRKLVGTRPYRKTEQDEVRLY